METIDSKELEHVQGGLIPLLVGGAVVAGAAAWAYFCGGGNVGGAVGNNNRVAVGNNAPVSQGDNSPVAQR
jgi:lactobin A/cerein 7B family class IIb bacteriocin